jgi:excisionase family DNA binding protein
MVLKEQRTFQDHWQDDGVYVVLIPRTQAINVVVSFPKAMEKIAMQEHIQNAQVKLLLTMEEAAQVLGLGRTSLYSLVMERQIASLKIGRSRRIPLWSLEAFIE